ncbi:MAG: ribose-phosphate diphosphokinase [Acidimicrobiia bacterium]
MTFRIVSGTANRPLAAAIATALATDPAPCEVERFPDGELRPVVDDIRGADVYIVQPTGPPVNENVMELLLLLDSCRRAGAERLTAVVPYFGYARQDRRGRAGQALGARVVADALAGAGAERLVVVDPHSVALEAMCNIPVEMLTAVPILAHALAEAVPDGAVVVAPDLGAVKLAEHYASPLGAPVAVVRKTRVSGTTVRAEEVVGDVEGRPAVIVDDMISTGATIVTAVRVVLAHGATAITAVAATHGLLVGSAVEQLRALSLRHVYVTDSLAPTEPDAARREVQSIAPLLADAIGCLHHDKPLDHLLIRT